MAQRLATISSSLANTSNSRLQEIRSRTKMDTQQLKDLLFSKGAFNRYITPIFQYIDNNRDIYTHHHLQNLNLQEQRRETVRMALHNFKHFKVDIKNQPQAMAYVRYATASFDIAVNSKASIHYMLYTNSLLLFGSNQKHSLLYERANSTEDLGCFALTEFHHGSYSKGIQTTATYQHSTKQFVLSTHGSKGMKFWIGGAAETANMCVIWAQLIVDGVSEGPHPFILPLRCSKTLKVLPGITIADCGPKNGLNGIDNGLIIIQDLKIPAQNLLGKFGGVDAQGKYKSPIKDKDRRFGVFMTALSSGRGIICLSVNSFAINALTIALRYACTRKQFLNNTNDDQITIIDYPITQVRIIPHFATIIVQLTAGEFLSKAYYQKDKVYLTDLQYGAQLHALAAAAKSRFTKEVTKIVGQCRTVLGGHGYSSLSALSKLYHSADVNTTFEGDNNILLQQTTKFLVKTIGNKQNTKILNLSFVNNQETLNLQSIIENLRSVANLESMFKDLLRTKYKLTKAKIEELKKEFGKQQADYHLHPEAGNSLSLTYADFFTFTIANSKLKQAKNAGVKVFLEKCLLLWGFVVLERERYGSHDLRKALQKQIIALSGELVDLSVVATDAIAPSGFVIGSPFADFNGQGFKEYVNILYTSKDTFLRSHYYEKLKSAGRIHG